MHPCKRGQVRSVEDVLSVGQEVEVLCRGRNARGHLDVSRKALMSADDAAPSLPMTSQGGPPAQRQRQPSRISRDSEVPGTPVAREVLSQRRGIGRRASG